MRLADFQALGPKYVLDLEQKDLKPDGSFFENRLSIYILKSWYDEGIFALPPQGILILQRHKIKG